MSKESKELAAQTWDAKRVLSLVINNALKDNHRDGERTDIRPHLARGPHRLEQGGGDRATTALSRARFCQRLADRPFPTMSFSPFC